MGKETKALQRAKHERQRRDLLLVLKGDYGYFVSVKALGDALGYLDHALSDDDVRFHLRYLEEAGLIDVEREDVPESRERSVIVAARLLKRGLDFLDGRERAAGVAGN